jgi:glycosyltransferase involved in cell wall biosynthesis
VHRAAWNWLSSLISTAPPERKFVVATGRTPRNEAALEALRSLGKVELCLSTILRGRASGHLWEQFRLPALLRSRGCRLMVNLANTMPLRPGMASLLAVMDASFMEGAAWFRGPFRTWYRLLLPALVRRADRVITISEFSRGEILRHFRPLPEKLEVVPLGCDHAVQDQRRGESGEAFRPPASPYLLTVGTLEPRKNLPLLVEAFRMLKARAPDLPHALLVVGAVQQVFQRAGVEAGGGVHFLGYLTDRQLDDCYRRAELFVYPSLYEGFGLPPLEAMARGVPTLAARAGALPEVTGGGAELFDPASAAELAALIERYLRSPALRAGLAERGRARAAAFRWEAAGRRLNAIIDGLR